jgi:hypothetical protein
MFPTLLTPEIFAPALKAAILPEPETARFIRVWSLVQLKVSPPKVFAAKTGTVIKSPGQAVKSPIAVTTGLGFIVTLKFTSAALQPANTAETVMFPTMAVPEIFAGAVQEDMFGDPDAPIPIDVLVLTQLKVEPAGVEAKFMVEIGSPGQTEMFDIALITGLGLKII